MQHAKTNLSRLVKQVASGQIIYIGAYGHAEAVLVSPAALQVNQPKSHKRIRILAGKLHVPEDFDAPLPDHVPDDFKGK